MKLKEFLPALLTELKYRNININKHDFSTTKQSEIIISFTSIPSRLNKIDIVIKSLILQSILPKKIVLWLHEDLENDLPEKVKALTKIKIFNESIFEIHYSKLYCSHRKLIHSLKLFPNSTILTCDDDSIYPNNWLELLNIEHEKFPNDIICNRCNFISYDVKGNTLPYTHWEKNVPNGTSSLALMPAGYAGIIYPPNSFHKDILDSSIFLKLAPKADDLWFKAMSYLNNTTCRKAKHISNRPITLLGSQKFTLGKTNISLDQNKTQWDQIRSYYGNFKTPNHQK